MLVFVWIWHGVSMLSSLGVREPDEAVTSDASGHWGCGAYWRSVWFQLAWEDPSQRKNIATQELVPIVVAAAIWGRHWHGLHIQCNSDNQVEVAVLSSQTSKDQEIMHLLRCLFFFEASFNFSVSGPYLPGRLNELADDLPQDCLSSFLQKTPHAIPANASASVATGPSARIQAGLDLTELERDVQYHFESCLATSTQKTYRSGISKFNQFCIMYNIADPLPVSQSLLCSYVVYLARSGLCCSTIRTYLSAIRYLQISRDLPEPRTELMPKLKMIETGVRKVQAAQQLVRRPRLPITPTILKQIKALWTPRASELDIIMLWAACCLCFFGFFRMGELTLPADGAYDPTLHLSFEDVAIDNPASPSVLQVILKRQRQIGFGEALTYLWAARTRSCVLLPQYWHTWQSEGQPRALSFGFRMGGPGDIRAVK